MTAKKNPPPILDDDDLAEQLLKRVHGEGRTMPPRNTGKELEKDDTDHEPVPRVKINLQPEDHNLPQKGVKKKGG